MPDFTLNDALEEAYASAPSGEVILHTLELRHPSFTAPIRVVRDHVDFTARLEATAPADPGAEVVFVGMAFEFMQPEMTKGGTPEFEIALDGVTGEVVAHVDAASQSAELIEATYRAYLASDRSGPQNNPPATYVLKGVSADVFRVRARAGYGDHANRRFPGETYDTVRFSGLLV